MKRGTVFQRHLKSCSPEDRATKDGRKRSCGCPWAYVLDVGVDAAGKRRQITKSGFRTKTEANADLEEKRKSALADVTALDLTVREYLETWLANKRSLKPSTAVAYRSYLDHYLIPQLGEPAAVRAPAPSCRPLSRQPQLRECAADPSVPSTVRRIHATLRSALNSAAKRRLITYNPSIYVDIPPESTDPSGAVGPGRGPTLHRPGTWRPALRPLPADPGDGHATWRDQSACAGRTST